MRILISDNAKEVAASLYKKSDIIKQQTVIELYNALTILEAAIKQNIRKRSGLNVRTGTLLNSVQKHIEMGSDGVARGTIGPENVPYAAIHEFGGVIPARRIEPRNAKALRWLAGGNVRFSKGHEIPAFNIKARPYLQPAMDEKIDIIREKFNIFLKKTMEMNT